MPGRTLVMSREKLLYPYFRKRLPELGFKDFELTGEERDSLNFLINDIKPRLVLAGSGFYKCCTPYMMGRLLKTFPGLNIAAVSVFCKIPDDFAMWFIYNGVKSYINFLEGPDEFYAGLEKVREGEEYVSPGVMERIYMRRELAAPAGNISPRQMEIIRLLCNGFTGAEICDVLAIAEDTLSVQKRYIYTCLNIRNEKELIRVALFHKWVTEEELLFFGGRYALNPRPEKQRAMKNEGRRGYDY
jgi:DNA-binding CsgD family transcriptional regulator